MVEVVSGVGLVLLVGLRLDSLVGVVSGVWLVRLVGVRLDSPVGVVSGVWLVRLVGVRLDSPVGVASGVWGRDTEPWSGCMFLKMVGQVHEKEFIEPDVSLVLFFQSSKSPIQLQTRCL